jgi:23S rRNA (adenine2503-C2)-methyltransferase
MINSILNYKISEVSELIAQAGFKRYRISQIFNEIYIQRKDTFDDMLLLPQKLRKLLNDNYKINSLELLKRSNSNDGSIKFLFELHDRSNIETVFMPKINNETGLPERTTLCISTMTGCPVGCIFCATGTIKKGRNLDVSEVISQILLTEKYLEQKISNIVIMGMGEPLLNFENVSKSLAILTDNNKLNISRKKITLSTIGIPTQIIELSKIDRPVKLSLSLHSTKDNIRQKLIPIAKSYKLQSIYDSLEQYYKQTKIPVTYEYILFEGINDTLEDASTLVKISKRFPSKINIIPFNDISFVVNFGLNPSSLEKTENFIQYLRDKNVTVTLRESFGRDIAAACGQLVRIMNYEL